VSLCLRALFWIIEQSEARQTGSLVRRTEQ
jgi:hypothetical protein